MKGSLIVVGFFLLGLLAGHSGTLPAWVTQCDISFVALCGLLLCVGIGIGMNPDMKSDIKSLSPRLALLPLVTILGSWLGAVVAFLIMSAGDGVVLQHRALTDCLALDSGFAYYSLSSIFITEYRGAELGTITLLAKWAGPLAPISTGGATTMDTTLPIITKTIGQKYVALSIYHGFVTDFTVPFLVTMWCMMSA